jgi:hypothetical protein
MSGIVTGLLLDATATCCLTTDGWAPPVSPFFRKQGLTSLLINASMERHPAGWAEQAAARAWGRDQGIASGRRICWRGPPSGFDRTAAGGEAPAGPSCPRAPQPHRPGLRPCGTNTGPRPRRGWYSRTPWLRSRATGSICKPIKRTVRRPPEPPGARWCPPVPMTPKGPLRLPVTGV